jgi:hypothetical protein
MAAPDVLSNNAQDVMSTDSMALACFGQQMMHATNALKIVLSSENLTWIWQ